MKIGFNFQTTDKYITGVENYSLGLLKALLRESDEHDYLVFTNQPDLIRNCDTGIAKMKIIETLHLKTRIQRIIWEHFKLPGIAKELELDVLHCPHYICPCRKFSVPYVTTIHDTIAIDRPDLCKRANSLYYGIFLKKALNASAKIIAVSKRTASDLKRDFNIDQTKLRIISPGVDAIFTPIRDSAYHARVRKNYGIPEKYILFVGSVEPRKNVIRLIKAYNLLKARGLDHKLVLVGKRTWKSKDAWQFIRSGIESGSIIHTGYVAREDLAAVYQMAEVFVFVSLFEGFGFPPLEAMACGTAVISSGSGALSETIGDAAYKVNPLDPAEIADAISLMIRNPELRNKYIELGIKQSLRFRWDRCAGETLRAYREAAKTTKKYQPENPYYKAIQLRKVPL